MDQGGTTWIVAADSREARFFEERLRGGPLKILSDHLVAESSNHGAHAQRATVHSRVGHGRHADGDHAPETSAAKKFAHDVARHLEAALKTHAFDALVIVAPPRTLGLLRDALAPELAKRLAASDPHDAVREDSEAMRKRLSKARSHAA